MAQGEKPAEARLTSEADPRLGSMAFRLGALARSGRSLRNLSRGVAPDGSVADREAEHWATHERDMDQLVAAYTSGQKSLVAAEACLLTVEASACVPDAGFPTAAALRTALEATGRAFRLLDAVIDADQRVDRFMNDVKSRNLESLGFAQQWKLPQEAIDDAERLDKKLDDDYFSKVGGRSSTPDRSALVYAIFAALDERGIKWEGADKSHWEHQARKIYWYLSNVAHGNKSALDSLVAWDDETKAFAGVLPATVYAEAMWLAGLAYAFAVTNAVELLGWDERLWEWSANWFGDQLHSLHSAFGS